ncbi:uncharacterized protein PRCAT00005576001 [Priceomyces carsonii]|uniref:uncharacterized protein n=1 Tax=Priceomyces carsonii TaxID=28549 RepID=UPI002ED9AE70|nr:unnamed protein product [Priceomyces carsonii]
MVKVEEILSTSTFAWSQGNLPLLATGTVAGAVDINFDSSSTLEIWDIFSSQDKKAPIFTETVDNRFYALAWSKPFDGRPMGLLAGAFENGAVEIWDAEILIKTKDLKISSIYKSLKHTGPVRCLQFNPNQDHILVSGGSHGEIYIWDTKNFTEPVSPGKAMTPMDEITSVAWNRSVGHILATTSNGGFTSIWDLKSKREVLHLSYNGPNGKSNFSHVAWHPTQSTKLATASDSDNCPSILTWDLRNSNAPEMILEGHKKGVLSLDWCTQDPELLLSSGKDNNTFLWNPIKGEKLGEYPTTANWAFLTRFAPAAPDIFATASFDGKIVVQTLQDTSPPITTKVSSKDDDLFWNEISVSETQQAVFEKQQAPSWLKNPSSVFFGFGSKIVTVGENTDGKSVVKIQKFATSSLNLSVKLSEALKNGDFKSLIQDKLNGPFLLESDRLDWELLNKLSDQGKEKLFELDLDKQESDPWINGSSKLDTSTITDDAFFDKLGNGVTNSEDYVPSGPFSLFDSTTPNDEKRLIKLLLNNKVDDAISSCLEQGKLLEALILALDASDEAKQKAKAGFFNSKKGDRLARLLYNVSQKNITDLVSSADASNWKEIATAITSFSTDESDFSLKINELGDRIFASNDQDKRINAISCYLAGNGLDKIANVWLSELPEFEQHLLQGNSDISSPSEAHFEALNNFVEKIATYRSLTNMLSEISGPSIEPIAKAILEYTNLVASFGHFELAEKFLLILPSEFTGNEKDRIVKALDTTSKTSSSNSKHANPRIGSSRTAYARPMFNSAGQNNAAMQNSPNISHKSSLRHYPIPSQAVATSVVPPVMGAPVAPMRRSSAVSNPSLPTPGVTNQYNRSVSSNPYARTTSNNPYAPSSAISNPYKPANAPSATEPLNSAQTSPLPPPRTNKLETEGWNDLPNTFKTKATAPARRAAAPVEPSPSPTPFSGVQLPPIAQKRPSMTSASSGLLPPPRRGISRTSSRASLAGNLGSSAEVLPPPRHASINNRYAPPSSATQEGLNGSANISAPSTPALGAPPAHSNLTPRGSFATTNAPPKNPYAPPPPPPATGAISAGNFSPNVSRASVTAPPKNPYAPPPGAESPRPTIPGVAPPPVRGGIAQPPYHHNQRSSLQVGSRPLFPPPPARSVLSAFSPSGQIPHPPVSSNPISPPIKAGMVPPPIHTYGQGSNATVANGPPPRATEASSHPVGQFSQPPTSTFTQPPPPKIQNPPELNNQPPAMEAPQAPIEPAKMRYPDGDRSHIPESSMPIYKSLTNVLEAIKPNIPEKYAKHGRDMEERLNLLFDHLNNNELLTPDTIETLKQASQSLEHKDFQTAASLNLEIATNHADEIGKWHTGVKRLITMAEVMY